MKKIALLLLTAILLTSFMGISAFASTQPVVAAEPRLVNTMSVSYNITFDSAKAGAATLSVTGKSGVNKIVGEVKVYRQDGSSWEFVAEDTVTAEKRTLTMSVPFDGESNEYYKAEYNITVYLNNVAEELSYTYYKTCP